MGQSTLRGIDHKSWREQQMVQAILRGADHKLFFKFISSIIILSKDPYIAISLDIASYIKSLL